MVKLRLQRFGAAKKPFYRIVAADSQAKRDGRFLEIVGTYDPTNKKEELEVKVNKEAILKWLERGAQPTDTVRTILSRTGILKEFADSKKESK